MTHSRRECHEPANEGGKSPRLRAGLPVEVASRRIATCSDLFDQIVEVPDHRAVRVIPRVAMAFDHSFERVASLRRRGGEDDRATAIPVRIGMTRKLDTHALLYKPN